MKSHLAAVAIASACLLAAARPAAAVNLQDTRLLTQPAISANHVLFVYAGDLWICDLNFYTVAMAAFAIFAILKIAFTGGAV